MYICFARFLSLSTANVNFFLLFRVIDRHLLAQTDLTKLLKDLGTFRGLGPYYIGGRGGYKQD